MGQFLRIGVGCLLQTVSFWCCLGSVRYVCSSAGCGGKGHCKTQLFWYVKEFILDSPNGRNRLEDNEKKE